MLCSCAVGPDYSAPDTVVPDLWAQQLEQEAQLENAPMQDWWAVFEDETLTSLIERSHTRNLSIQRLAQRVGEFRMTLAIARSEKFPAVSGTGSAERSRGSDGVAAAPPPQSRTDTFRELGATASWEVDLWGRVRRSVESALASYESSIEDLRDIQVSVYAQVATEYLTLRTLQERLVLAKANVDIQRGTLKIVEARYEAQLTPLLDVRQAEQNLFQTLSVIPDIEASIESSLFRLSVLLGELPNALSEELGVASPLPELPDAHGISAPANTVRQRPDIRSAERQLAAQTAQIGVAIADLYPNFFLFGDFAYSTVTGPIVDRSNRSWGIGTFFSWNLFNAGRVRSNVKAEEFRTQQALLNYEETVLDALREVEESLISYIKEKEKADFLANSVVAAIDAEQLVTDQYRQGLTNFQNVLDTQRSLFDRQDQLATSQGTALINLVSVYRAMGGGWAALPEVQVENPK
ncbi:MAG: efflux transporter outer membrane subunit [Pseudomonadota bacterium]